MRKLVIIAGPTAVGKTASSILLAKKIGGEIISADSMQVYRGMDVGTAKIRKEEMEGVPHFLIDAFDLSTVSQAGDGRNLCPWPYSNDCGRNRILYSIHSL